MLCVAQGGWDLSFSSSGERRSRISVRHCRSTRWPTAHCIRTFALNAALVALAVGNSACAPNAGKPANPKAWFSADSIVLRDGDAVNVWPDSSLNGHHATATESNRPTYRIVDDVPLVQFDGVDDYMIAGAADDWTFLHDGSEWTLFVVLRTAADGLGGTHVLLDSGGVDSANRGFAMSYDVSGRNEAIRVSVAQNTPGRFALDMATGDDSFTAGQWGIVSAISTASRDGPPAEAQLFVNGHQKVSGEISSPLDGSSPASELNIGRYGFGNTLFAKGDIKEIVIYDRVLSEAEHYAVIEYLATSLATDVRIRYPSSRKWLGYDPAAYQAFGIAFRIPSTGKLVAIQRQGTTHAGSAGEVRQWESTDRGATWTSRSIYDSQYDDRNVAGGRASRTGSILAFLARHDGVDWRVNWIDMRALRSTDDGETFLDVGAPLPTNGCSVFSPYGPMIELPSGRLLQTFYGGGCANFKVWVSESVDDGQTWTYKADIYRGNFLMNETSLAWISGSDDASSTLVAVSRNDGGGGLFQSISTDGGSTWSSQGLIPDGDTLDLSPWLYRTSGGMLVLAWHERTAFTFLVRVAPATAVAEGPGNWGAKQVTYRAVTRVIGESGYPSLLSATGWDDDLIQVIYDRTSSGTPNLLINPISLP